MKRARRFIALPTLLGFFALGQVDLPAQDALSPRRNPAVWQASGTLGAVAAGGRGAVDAGIQTLKKGGNAADAAVATILALTVTDSASVCFGGEVPIMLYNAKRKTVEVIAGQGVAPDLATRAYFVEKGGIPTRGVESATVPALLDACLVTLERAGTMTFAEVVGPTIRLLDAGRFEWNPNLARTLRRLVEAEKTGDGDRIVGLRRVADAFYRGPIAWEIDAWARTSGGLIRYRDLASHVTRVEDPVSVDYRGLSVLKCGVWTQGPFLLQTLQILEGYDLKSWARNSPRTIHATVEAMKLGLADRDRYYADPLVADVPPAARLLDPAYAKNRRALIDPNAASTVIRPGDPIRGRATTEVAGNLEGNGGIAFDTTTCLVADAEGNVVAATPSGWSGVVAGDTGVWLGSRLQSFNTWPDHPNVIAPGKRPRITLTPTIVLNKERRPVLAISVAGGDNQDQMSIQLILNHVDFGMTPGESVSAPRFMTEHLVGSFGQTKPKLASLRINPEVGTGTLEELTRLGHVVTPGAGPIGAAPIVLAVDPKTGRINVAGDPKAGRHVDAY